MTVRMRGSRILAGLALVAATAMTSSAVVGVAPPIAAMQVAAARAAASAGVSLAQQPSVLVMRAVPRVRPGIHGVRGLSAAPHSIDSASAKRMVAVGVLGSLVVGAALLGWMLDFVRRSSRTRGQPREGALVA